MVPAICLAVMVTLRWATNHFFVKNTFVHQTSHFFCKTYSFFINNHAFHKQTFFFVKWAGAFFENSSLHGVVPPLGSPTGYPIAAIGYPIAATGYRVPASGKAP